MEESHHRIVAEIDVGHFSFKCELRGQHLTSKKGFESNAELGDSISS